MTNPYLIAATSVYDRARAVRARTGKSVASQLWEILRLRLRRDWVGITEYYDFNLFDDSVYSWRQKQAFISDERRWDFYDIANDPKWWLAADEKAIFYSIMHAKGIAHPVVLLLLDKTGRTFENAPTITTLDELKNALRHEITCPFFAKPSSACYGRQASSVDRYDRSTDSILLKGGDRMTVDAYVGQFASAGSKEPGEAFIFQERLEPHPETAPYIGHRVMSLRVVVLLSPRGPKVWRVVAKIPAGRNIIDNFAQGRSGNHLAKVDPRTGVLQYMLGPSDVGTREVQHHPDTGRPLAGVALPEFRETIDLCLQASTALPGVRLQSWDVAICSRGPVVLECNPTGSVDIVQFVPREGFLDSEMRQFLAGLAHLKTARGGRAPKGAAENSPR